MSASEIVEDVEDVEDVENIAEVLDDESEEVNRWAETPSPMLETNDPSPDDPVESVPDLPDALKNLIALSGAQLQAVDREAWNINGWVASLRRNLSVTFSADGELSSADVLEAFLKIDVSLENITAIQYKNSNRLWVVSFNTEKVKDDVLKKGLLMIKDALVFLGDADMKTIVVKIFEAPTEMPFTVLIGRLSYYGHVLSFRRDCALTTGIFNGVSSARMRLSKVIPSTIRLWITAAFNLSPRPEFLKTWTHQGALCSIVEKKLVFNF